LKLPWRQQSADQANLPQEVQQYYQAEQRERMGVASLLALGTLIVTVLLAAGIFFGGRWVWRHTAERNRSKTNVATTGTVQAPDDKTSSSTTSSSTTNSSASSSTSTPVTSSSGSNNAASQPSSAATPSSPTSTPSQTTSTPTSTTTTALANTGPTSILPIALVSVIVGFGAAEWYQRRSS